MSNKKLIISFSLSLIALTISVSVFSYVIMDNKRIEEEYGELFYLGYTETTRVLDMILDEPIRMQINGFQSDGLTAFDDRIFILGQDENYTQRKIVEIKINDEVNTIIDVKEHNLPFLNSSLNCMGLGYNGTNFFTLLTLTFPITQYFCTFNITHGIISNRTLSVPTSSYPDVNDLVRTNFDIWNDKIYCTEGGELDGYWVERNITCYDLNTLNIIDSFNITNFGRPRQFSIDESGQAWITYNENPFTNPQSSSGTRFSSVWKSFLDFSLETHNLLSTIHVGGGYPDPLNTSLELGAWGEYFYYFNDTYVMVQDDRSFVYHDRIIQPLYMRADWVYYFVGFRVYSYDPIDLIKSSELQTLILSFTIFLGVATYTVILSLKKINHEEESEIEST